MLSFTAHLHSIPVSINPAQVTHVTETLQGCVVHFSSGSSIHLANNYLEVVGTIAGHLK